MDYISNNVGSIVVDDVKTRPFKWIEKLGVSCMYFEHIHVENFRGIESMELDFKPGVNILIGDNGTGKTTVLEALTVALGGYLKGIQNLTARGLLQDDFRWSMVNLAGASRQVKYYAPKIEFELNINGNSLHGMRSRSDRDGSTKTITRCTEIQKAAMEMANDESSNLPLLSYMSISRVTLTKRSDFGKTAKNQLNDRRSGYIGCLESTIDKASILEWFKKISYESILHNKNMPEWKLFQKTVAVIMKEVNELDELPQVYYSSSIEDIAYVENGKIQPISILSSGYQSLLWMAMDFAFRLALLNPELQSPEEAVGIIIIDEIDMHLHPKWQWNALKSFSKTFPKIQFIIATHAPIIIASGKGANLIQLTESGEPRYLEDAYAYSVNSVLESRQNSTGVLKELRDEISKFDQLLNEGRITEAKDELHLMERLFGYHNTEVVEARTEYELETLTE